ncbi:MAG: mercuric reductase [Deltaproteobacteria bacterium]|nr:mercuric reductase [Deltaproteobacteria bacterium]
MASDALKIAPLDVHNRALLAQVHPPGWRNPRPANRYNLVVVGAGTAGLVCAVGAAGLGAKVAIVERDFMGGDCLNFGCVPSKALIRSTRAVAEARSAAVLGVKAPSVGIDFSAAMERMRRIRAELAPNDSAERLRDLGVDVFIGEGRFTSRDQLEVDGQSLRFRRAVIATGARAAMLPISGLSEANSLTNETIFSLTELPRRLAVIGAGPIGCELAQVMGRFGSQVTLLEVESQILIREDRDAAERVERALKRDGITITTAARILAVEKRGTEKVLRVEVGGVEREISVDEILLGVGRLPNVDGLGLEAAGVQYDRSAGVKVDDCLRTTNASIYAAGDCASALKFTHLSDAHARIVLRNALFLGRARVSVLTVPWCTYTDPEIAHVGLYEADALKHGIKITTYVQEMAEVDRAVLDGETEGFLKVHVKQGTDQIVGATLVARHAGELISELTTAMVAGVGLGKLAEVVHPYPTQAEVIRKIANQYNRTRLTPFAAKMFRRWFAWTR